MEWKNGLYNGKWSPGEASGKRLIQHNMIFDNQDFKVSVYSGLNGQTRMALGPIETFKTTWNIMSEKIRQIADF